MPSNQFYLGNKNLPTPNATFEYTEKEIKALKRAGSNIVWFAQNFFFITSLDSGKQVIKLYKSQKRVLEALQNHDRLILCASRQIGKTTLMSIYALWLVCFNSDKNVLLVANREATAITILRRIRTAYELLPNWLKPGVKEYGKTEIILANDSRIVVSTTTATAARGESCNCLIIDEMSFIDNSIIEEFMRSTLPIVSSSKNSKVFIVSTPNGTQNEFYKIYSRAEAGDGEWYAEKIMWHEFPGRDDDWRKKTISTLGSEEAFEQEYGCVFLDHGESSIDGAVIRKFKDMIKPPISILEEGCYKIWKNPDSSRIYSIGVDVSEGIGKCNSVIAISDVTDLKNIELVANYVNNKIDPFHFAKIIFQIAHQWGKPPLIIERNACGGQVIDALYETHRYPYIVRWTANNTHENRNLGIMSHTNEKFNAVMNLRYWANSLRVLNIYDINTVQEIETFVRFPNGTWKKQTEDLYDDRIMALIWSLMILNTEIACQYYSVPEFDERGKPLRIERVDFEENKYFKIPSIALSDEFKEDHIMPMIFGHTPDNEGEQKEEDLVDLINGGWTFIGGKGPPQNDRF